MDTSADNLNIVTNYLFGPLDQAYYCNFFLVLTVFGFVFFIGSVFILLYGLSHQVGFAYYLKAAMIMFFYFIFYIQSRILYSMCSGTLTK
jgi:hypothetical protein